MYGVTFTHKPSKNHAYAMLLAGVAISVLFALFSLRSAAWTGRIDHLILDTLLRYSASEEKAEHTVVIDIDDVSINAVGQWPWPRYRMAALVQAIAAARPASVGIDVLFSEPDRSSLLNVQEAFKRDFDVDVVVTGAPAGLLDNDGYLGAVLSDVGAVTSKYFYFDQTTAPEVNGDKALRFSGRTDSLALNDATGVLSNTRKIASQTKLSGFINNRVDDDGRLRKVPLLIRHNGTMHANLALATVMKALGTDSATIEGDKHGPFIRVGGHAIPIDEKGYALLRFNGGPNRYPAISAVNILNGSFDKGDIKGKVVLVGSSAAGLNDLHNTAFDAQFPGVKLQAVVAEDIKTDSFLRNPAWSTAAIALACVLLGLYMSGLFVWARGAFWIVGGSALAAFLILDASVLLFLKKGMFVSPGAPLLVIVALLLIFSITRFAIEKRYAYTWFKRLENARMVTMESMAAVAETRDPETGAHLKRVQHYVKATAEELRRSGSYADILTHEYIDLLFISSPLHDLGKVGVPDHILLKKGKLTDEEFVVMKQHAEYGRSIISSTSRNIEGENFLLIAGEIAATHHEKWDGTGYPLGLKGQQIPLSGRIMAIADIYDALISKRCYKEPFPHQTATEMMQTLRGATFDPVVFDAFFRIEDEVKAIAAKYAD